VDEPLAEIRLHAEQISADKDRLCEESFRVLRKNAHAHAPDGQNCAACARAFREARGKLRKIHYRDLNLRARRAAAGGRLAGALGLALRALWRDPAALARPMRMRANSSFRSALDAEP
jgi:hypothetical protein